jgi:hypothetical protein
MPGFMPGIHVFLYAASKTWMAGTSPAMTVKYRCGVPCQRPEMTGYILVGL